MENKEDPKKLPPPSKDTDAWGNPVTTEWMNGICQQNY